MKVSRDGVHKLVGIWQYEKRAVNGANFVYFGTRLLLLSILSKYSRCIYSIICIYFRKMDILFMYI